MYLGQLQLGTWLDVYLQVTNGSGVCTMPDHVPQIKIRDASNTLVLNQLMPVIDKTSQIGLFCSRLFLGSAFSVGIQTVTMFYRVGSKIGIETRVFEVIAGGNARGCVLGMVYLHKPHADFVVYQTESGTIERGKNPRVN